MMRLSVLSLLVLVSWSLDGKADDFEELPILQASEILRPEILAGPNYKVREEVPTFSGVNRYTIDSEFGVFAAEGNEMLLRRINEINAIGRLKEVSRTDEFKEALKKAAKGPAAAARAIVTDPARTLTNVPRGVMKFMGRVGESVKGLGEKHQGRDPEGSQLEQLIGFADTKRKVAVSLGVDPYSTNTILQHELNGIAWAAFAGGATFSLATMPIGGGAATALTVTQVSDDFDKMLSEKSPTDLRVINRRSLLELGATPDEAERFLNNNAFSPSAQTALVLNLKSLGKVANRQAFLRLATRTSASEEDAIFWVQTSALLSKLQEDGTALSRLEILKDFPIAIAKDGTTVVALQWDYAAWTAGAAAFSEAIEKTQAGRNKILIAISGEASPRLKQEAAARGHKLRDRIAPGPLK